MSINYSIINVINAANRVIHVMLMMIMKLLSSDVDREFIFLPALLAIKPIVNDL